MGLTLKKTEALVRAAFLVVFVGLVYSNFSLRRQLEGALSPGTAGRSTGMFAIGDAVPRFVARDRSDRVASLGGASDRDRLLVLVHPKCKYCMLLVKGIAARPSSNLTVVSIVPKHLSAEVTKAMPASVPLYFIDQIQKSPLAPHAHGVPQILRVSADGRVTEVCRSIESCTPDSRGGP